MEFEQSVLLIEDDQVDQLTIKRAFKDAGVMASIDIAINGEDAISYLSQRKNNLPGLILLDLNMPRMNGLEFLKIIKSEVDYRLIPVVVMTTSKDIHDKKESFNLGAAGYIIKSVDYNDFVKVIKTVCSYWMINEKPF